MQLYVQPLLTVENENGITTFAIFVLWIHNPMNPTCETRVKRLVLSCQVGTSIPQIISIIGFDLLIYNVHPDSAGIIPHILNALLVLPFPRIVPKKACGLDGPQPLRKTPREVSKQRPADDKEQEEGRDGHGEELEEEERYPVFERQLAWPARAFVHGRDERHWSACAGLEWWSTSSRA